MQRSPCHECYLASADKNGPECLNCEKRTDYVASLEGRSGPVPMEMTDMVMDSEKIRHDDQFMRDNPDMRPADISAALGRTVAAIYVRRAKLGLTKDKRLDLIKARGKYRKSIKTDPPAHLNSGATAADHDREQPMLKDSATPAAFTPAASLLVVNAGGFGDLYERLKRSAKENFRTPELQALWFIHQALQAEDGARDQRRAPDRSS